MSDEVAIKVENISKTFHEQAGSKSFKEAFVNAGKKLSGKKEKKLHKGDFTALKDINFEIKKGDFFGIVGRNGCGKSTLLKIIAGVYTPTTGAVTVNGKLTPFIELGVGFNPELSGRDNVFLNGALLGFTHKEMEEMYEDIVEFAELENFMDVKLKNYSSGMQVRLAFSVAIRAESDILLIDEVLAVGDIKFQKKCYEYFKNLKKNHKTVVFVSHDMGAIKDFCNNAILIDDAKEVSTNNIDDLLEKYMAIMNPTAKELAKKKDSQGIKLLQANSVVTKNTITLKFKFSELVIHEELFVAFSVKNINDVLFAYNTARLNKPIKIKKAKVMEVEWQFDNVLTTGKYHVNFAVVNREGHAIDRFEDVLSFSNKGIERSVTAVNPNIVIKQTA